MDQGSLVFEDRSERGKLRFTGPQRGWFLHQITTQAFEDIAPGEARDAAMITPHGRMVGYLQALAVPEAIYVHFDQDLRADLPDAIAKYVLATRVEIEDVTDTMGLVLVTGEAGDIQSLVPADAYVHPTADLGVAAAYVWVPRSETQAVLVGLSRHGRQAQAGEFEQLRIEHAVPRWGREMDHQTIPLEVGLEDNAIHFDKGCYVGQEAIAKIHLRGKVNRKLRVLRVSGSVDPGAMVSKDGAAAGKVTSVAEGAALAILRHNVEPGEEVLAGEVSAVVVE